MNQEHIEIRPTNFGCCAVVVVKGYEVRPIEPGVSAAAAQAIAARWGRLLRLEVKRGRRLAPNVMRGERWS